MVALVESGSALESMRNSDFDANSAFGEVIDNSLQAGAKRIAVQFLHNTSDPQERIIQVAFGDDGSGMPSDVLHRCLQLGYSSRYNDRSGIGRFGVGAILGAINQCKRVEVWSKVKGGEWLWTYVDLDMCGAKPPTMTEIPIPQPKKLPAGTQTLTGTESGTLVVWSKYDRQPARASEIVAELKIWAGRVYRYFIWDGIEFYINGQNVNAIDPLYAKTEKTAFPADPVAQLYDPIEFDWTIPEEDRVPGGPTKSKVTIRMSMLPEAFRQNQGAGNSKEARDRHIDDNQGISILRNRREVFYDHIPYWPGDRFAEIDRWWGCEIHFDAVLDRAFTVKNIKRGAVPTTDLKKLIKDKIEPTRKSSLEKVRATWEQNKSAQSKKNQEEGVSFGHEDAERVAKNTPTPKGPAAAPGNDADAEKKLFDDLMPGTTTPQQEAWKEKFKNQPFSIVVGNWAGPQFIEVTHYGGSDVITYNSRHPFIKLLQSLGFEEGDLTEPKRKELAVLVDLLLLSFARAQAMFSPTTEAKAEILLEQLCLNWGSFLKSYVDAFQSEKQ